MPATPSRLSLSIDAQNARKVQCEVGRSEEAQGRAHRRGCEVQRERGAPLAGKACHAPRTPHWRRQHAGEPPVALPGQIMG